MLGAVPVTTPVPPMLAEYATESNMARRNFFPISDSSTLPSVGSTSVEVYAAKMYLIMMILFFDYDDFIILIMMILFFVKYIRDDFIILIMMILFFVE